MAAGADGPSRNGRLPARPPAPARLDARPPTRASVPERPSTRARGALLLALAALAGCAVVGPDYQSPEAQVPARWSATRETRAPQPDTLARWWREFDDPELEALVTEALQANLDLAAAQARLREARARRRLAGAELAPSVEVSGSAARTRSSGESGAGATRELYRAGFDANWEVDLFGGLRRGVEAAEADVGASLERLHDTQVSLLAELALNYVDLRTAQRRLAVTEESVRARNETLALTRWRFEAGLVSELDVAQATTDLETTRAALPALRNAASQARHRLAVLLGRAPGELEERLGGRRAIPLAARELFVGIPADVVRQRPDVRATERDLAASTARLGQAQAARYPALTLSGSLGLEALTLGALASDEGLTHSLLAGVTAPLLDAGRIEANVEAQDARVEQARLAWQSSVLTALEEVENALVEVDNNGVRRERLTQAAASAREALQLAEQRYASGLVDFLTVLDGQRTLLALEDDLASTTGQLAGAQIRTYKALGGGWSQEVAP